MIFNQQEYVSLRTTIGTILEVVQDFIISDAGCIAATKASTPGKHKHGETRDKLNKVIEINFWWSNKNKDLTSHG